MLAFLTLSVIVLLPPKECLLSESCEARGGTQRGGSQEPMGEQAEQAPEDPGLWSENLSLHLVGGFFCSWLGKFGNQAYSVAWL